MSLIGTLEQFSLAHVLQRIETYGKTGLFKIQQGTQWVELYFHEGRLLCLGPVKGSATLGERLLQKGVISAQGLQETLLAIADAPLSETRVAFTLMELGHVERDALRAWATREASDVLQVILTWPSGGLYLRKRYSRLPIACWLLYPSHRCYPCLLPNKVRRRSQLKLLPPLLFPLLKT